MKLSRTFCPALCRPSGPRLQMGVFESNKSCCADAEAGVISEQDLIFNSASVNVGMF
jgi:hypothetical protein